MERPLILLCNPATGRVYLAGSIGRKIYKRLNSAAFCFVFLEFPATQTEGRVQVLPYSSDTCLRARETRRSRTGDGRAQRAPAERLVQAGTHVSGVLDVFVRTVRVRGMRRRSQKAHLSQLVAALPFLPEPGTLSLFALCLPGAP